MSFGRRRRHLAWIAALLIPAASVGTSAISAHASTVGTGTAGTRPIAGTQPEWARSAAYRGPAGGSAHVSARIWLSGRDSAGLAEYAREVSTRGTAVYHHFLTPAQFRARFGSTSAQRSDVASWARSAGLTVTGVNDHYVSVQGTLASASRAFSVRFGDYIKAGTIQWAGETDARVPADLASAVLTVTGLDSAPSIERPLDADPSLPQNRWNTGKCSTYWNQYRATSFPTAYGTHAPYVSCGYTPQQLRSAYGVTASGLTGKGVTVAIVDAYQDPTIVSDINQYSADNGIAGLKSGQFTEDMASSWNSTAGCGAGGWYTEATIDTEAVHDIAPDANILYAGAASCNDNDLETALLNIVDNHLASIVSNSWSATEDQETANMAAYDQIFQQGATEGIGFYFGSGDAGYNDPNTVPGANTGSDKIQASYPGSSPWATGVGGTALQISSNGAYESETSYGDWRDSLATSGTSWTDPLPGTYATDFYEGGGGGTSYSYDQPWYQQRSVPASLSETLPDGATSSTPMRETPDVAMDADPGTGIEIGETITAPDGTTTEYARALWGGTSLATPLFAAMQALAEQAQGSPIGFANPEIYARYQLGLTNVIKPTSNQVDYVQQWYTDPYTQTTPVLTYLNTAGVDGSGASALTTRNGYSDATGVGSVGLPYLNSFK
jgi:subtilase family serine protease